MLILKLCTEADSLALRQLQQPPTIVKPRRVIILVDFCARINKLVDGMGESRLLLQTWVIY
eukprot:scaffold179_cov368-Prasinococcus_capsulatus_cf.AAC.22